MAVNGAAVPASATVVGTNSSKQVIAASLPSADIFVGNGSNLPAVVGVSGDASLANTGAVTNTGINGAAVPASAVVAGTNSSKQVIAAALPSADIFVGNGSNLPVAVAVSGDASLANTGAVTNRGVNGAAVPASATALASNASKQLVSATYQGNGAKVQLSTGTTITSDCVKFDANGNTIDAGAACGSGGGALSVQSGNLGNFTGGSGARLFGTTYQNTLAVPIFVEVTGNINSSGFAQLRALTDSSSSPSTIVGLPSMANQNGSWLAFSFWVLPGNYYQINATNLMTSAGGTGSFWIELH